MEDLSLVSEIYNNIKFNMQKLIVDVPEDDIQRISAIFNADKLEVEELISSFHQTVREETERIRNEISIPIFNGKKTIVFIGDSITSDRESYQKIIRELYKDIPSVKIIDAAFSGDKSDDAVMKIYERTLIFKPDVALILLGTNDIRRNDDEYARPCVSFSDIEKNIRYIIRVLQNRGTRVILTTISPIINEQLKARFRESNWHYDPKEIETLNALICQIAADSKVKLNDMRSTYGEYLPKDILLNDGLHLNRLGQRLLLRNTLSCILDVL